MISKNKALVNIKTRLSGTAKMAFLRKIFKQIHHLKRSKSRILTPLLFSFFILCLTLFGLLNYFSYFSKINNGSFETAQYLNSLPKSEKLVIWSNNVNFCQFFKGKCYTNSDIPQYAEFDYFVFFMNQDKNAIINEGTFSDLKKYAFKKIGVKKRDVFLTKAEIVKHSDIPVELLPEPAEFTFAIIGDSQKWLTTSSSSKTNQFYSILQNIKEFNPAFLLAMGDLTADFPCQNPEDCKPYYEQWRDEVEKYVPVIHPALGNHDESNLARNFYKTVFSLPENGPTQTDAIAYSFDFKNSHFVFVDSEKAFQQQEGTDQMNWLKDDLANNLKRNTFLISHAPNFSKPLPRQTYQWKLLFENNVFAQFSGDTHLFCQRIMKADELQMEGGEVNHFIIGNSGSMNHPYPPECEKRYRGPHFAIVKIKGSQMNLSVYNFKGVKIAETVLTNKNYFAE